jgi:general secretion pathway protein I
MDRPLIVKQNKAFGPIGFKGFTILEVMVALAVLSIALTGIYRLHGQTMVMSGNARFYTLAPMLAQAKLSEIEHQDYSALATSSGEYGEEYPGYQWALQFEDVPTDLFTEKYYHLTRIDIDISQNEENHYNLRTYRFFAE